MLSVEPTYNPYIAPAKYTSHYNAGQMQLRPNVPLHASLPPENGQWKGKVSPIELDRNSPDITRSRSVRTRTSADMLEDTHIMIFADHGDMHGSHGMFLKTNPFEESIRILMIISGSESFYDGHLTGICETLFAAVDIAPISRGLCGIDAPAFMEGSDLSGSRLSRRPKAKLPDSLYLQNVIPTGHPDSIDLPCRGLVTAHGWKLVSLPNEPWLMFNLAEDPYEEVNLAFNSLYAEPRKRLEGRLAQWILETSDEFPLSDGRSSRLPIDPSLVFRPV